MKPHRGTTIVMLGILNLLVCGPLHIGALIL